MKHSFSFFYIVVVLFGCCAWLGSSLFILEHMNWMIEKESMRTTTNALLHTNNFRAMCAGVLSALIWSYPAIMVSKHKWSVVGYLLIMPVAIISTAAIYLSFWPPKRQMHLSDALTILIASGWKQFLIAYLCVVLAPLQIISHKIRRSLLGTSIENLSHGQ